jgi:hypothetical protein
MQFEKCILFAQCDKSAAVLALISKLWANHQLAKERWDAASTPVVIK